eukprot:12527456-Alexandrium_andersonii.AAC.1
MVSKAVSTQCVCVWTSATATPTVCLQGQASARMSATAGCTPDWPWPGRCLLYRPKGVRCVDFVS